MHSIESYANSSETIAVKIFIVHTGAVGPREWIDLIDGLDLPEWGSRLGV